MAGTLWVKLRACAPVLFRRGTKLRRSLYTSRAITAEFTNPTQSKAALNESPREKYSFRGLQTDFPCLLKNPSAGPEPKYDKIVSGYKTFHYDSPFYFKYDNGVLPEVHLAYETWGELNSDKTNAILLHGGLSASSHAKSHADNAKHGWWEKFIGSGIQHLLPNILHNIMLPWKPDHRALQSQLTQWTLFRLYFIGCAVDTDKYFVVCINTLGGCYGR